MMDKKYLIAGLKLQPEIESVEMLVIELFKASQERQPLDPSAIIQPMEAEPHTDEERYVKQMFDAMKKYAPSLQSIIGVPSNTGGLHQPASRQQWNPALGICIYFTVADYKKMGSPHLLDVLNLSFSVEKKKLKISKMDSEQHDR